MNNTCNYHGGKHRVDCLLYLTQYLYDPGILPGCANECILGMVYLRSNLLRKHCNGVSTLICEGQQHTMQGDAVNQGQIAMIDLSKGCTSNHTQTEQGQLKSPLKYAMMSI